jgi:hypothetical protein
MQINSSTSAQLSDGSSGHLLLDSQNAISAWGAPPVPQASAALASQSQAQAPNPSDFHDADESTEDGRSSSLESQGVADAVDYSPTPRRGRLPFSRDKEPHHISSVPTPARPPRPPKKLEPKVLPPIEGVRVWDPTATHNSIAVDFEASRSSTRASSRSHTPVASQVPPQIAFQNGRPVVALDLQELTSTFKGHILFGTPKQTPSAKTPKNLPFARGTLRASDLNPTTPRAKKTPEALRADRLSRLSKAAPAPSKAEVDDDEQVGLVAHLVEQAVAGQALQAQVPLASITIPAPFDQFLDETKSFVKIEANEPAKITRILTLAKGNLANIPGSILERLRIIAPQCGRLKLEGDVTTGFLGKLAEIFTNLQSLHLSDIVYTEFNQISLAQFTKLQNLKITGNFVALSKVQPDTLQTLWVDNCKGFFPQLLAKISDWPLLQELHFSRCDDLGTSQIQLLFTTNSHVKTIDIEACEQVDPSIQAFAARSGVTVRIEKEGEKDRDEHKAKASSAQGVTFEESLGLPKAGPVIVDKRVSLPRSPSRLKSIGEISLSAISALSEGSVSSGDKRRELYQQGLKATLALSEVFKRLLALEGGTPERPTPSPTPSQAHSEAQAQTRPRSGSGDADAVSVSSEQTVRTERKDGKPRVKDAIATLTSSLRGLSVSRTPRKKADFSRFERANFTGNAKLVSELFTEAQLNLETIPASIYGKVKSAASTITRLDVPGAQLSSKNLRKLFVDFKQLRILNVTKADIHKGALKDLRGVAQLHIAESTGFDEHAAKDLLSCRETLETLDCSSTPVTDASIKRILGEFPKLKTLSANKTGFSDAHIDLAIKNPTLTLLNVSGSQVTSAKVGQVGRKTLKIVA